MAEYDPLLVSSSSVTLYDTVVHDKSRNRDIPVRVYLPAVTYKVPVVLFSHGLGGASTNNKYLGNHWAGRGYVAVFMQHPGSDEALWKDKPKPVGFLAMKMAASGNNFLLRVQDVKAVIDSLAIWNQENGNTLFGKLDMEHIGMSGHSFGGVTTQAVSGQVLDNAEIPMTDTRIKAAIIMSPSLPRHSPEPEKTFGKVTIPWLLMTGTNDNSPIGTVMATDRMKVYDALPEGDKYELILYKGEHSAFGDRPLPGEKEPRNPNHYRIILAISTAFWDAYLKGDKAALAWLNSKNATSIMEKQDIWKTK